MGRVAARGFGGSTGCSERRVVSIGKRGKKKYGQTSPDLGRYCFDLGRWEWDVGKHKL